ncbi:DUF6867 family protein [Mangrovibrevibacter kandeliae]|uniref:DUF6867 family protein n=1 Tax=Mangrovibrevibacter kandeliae TaxID=2968473 RepID=UPI0021186E12|nr:MULTISPECIES: hypothetical protein [unclassified Aurantimonas]MCQ8781189.1 hypothetical protein [Aurantimonas sp. CSK15Z-1]MCW4113966.1 hypothetical protein [Aurantimonas sp. MSK8Z-1]
MQPEMGLLWEVSVVEFLIVTVVLGGAAAWMIGRSTAITWGGWGTCVFYVLLLTVAVRFIHFSLFGGSFFLPPATFGTALHYAVVDFVVLMALAAGGRHVTRSGQMARQYGFLHRSA